MQSELRQILHSQTSRKPMILFVPSVNWESGGHHLFQRPQQLALALARQGALVFYMQALNKGEKQGFSLLEDGLYLSSVPLETFWILEQPLVYALTWNLRFLLDLENPHVIYDYLDDIETFTGDRREMRRHHQKTLKSASLVLATSHRLQADAQKSRPDALLCPNGVDYTHFQRCRQPSAAPPPGDMQPFLQQGKKIAGYYGALARWFDYPLLRQVAQMRPDLNFILLGCDLDNTLQPSELLTEPNIHWLGIKPYETLPDYLRYFDVTLIPFVLNEITHSTSPLKLFEYLGGGKPVILTPMEESLRCPGVLPARDAEAFSHQIDEGLRLAQDAAYLQLSSLVAQENTWQQRADLILHALRERKLV
jgi:glycosyltransferase involved in cell wall biosynthesis